MGGGGGVESWFGATRGVSIDQRFWKELVPQVCNY